MPNLRLLPPVVSLADRRRQIAGEVLRTICVRAGAVRLVTETPDGARITEILTPAQAREWADDLLDAADQAEGRR